MDSQRIGLLRGGKKDRYFVGFRSIPQVSIKNALAFAAAQGWARVNITHSGVYYELRSDGWWETSDSDYCDRVHGIPSEGLKIS